MVRRPFISFDKSQTSDQRETDVWTQFLLPQQPGQWLSWPGDKFCNSTHLQAWNEAGPNSILFYKGCIVF